MAKSNEKRFSKYYKYLPKELSTRHAYNEIWKLLNEAAEGILKEHRFVNPRYTRLDVMKEDIMEKLIEDNAKTKDISINYMYINWT
jgi:hypothetical protein